MILRIWLITQLFRVYQVLRSVRYSVLTSVFGVAIHCKHTPTCGTYLFRAIKSDGIIKGGMKGLLRVLTCW